MWLGKWKPKSLCSQVVQALLISRWLLSTPPWGGTRHMQSIDKKHSASTVNLPLYFPSPQLILHQATRCTFLLTWWKYKPLQLYTQTHTRVPFTSQHSTRSGTGYRVLQHLHEGLCCPSWGIILNYAPNFCIFKKITWGVSAAKQATLLLHLGAAVVSFGSKKAGWACGTEKLQVQIEFSHCNFLYRTFNSSAANSFTHWEDSKSWGYHNS